MVEAINQEARNTFTGGSLQGAEEDALKLQHRRSRKRKLAERDDSTLNPESSTGPRLFKIFDEKGGKGPSKLPSNYNDTTPLDIPSLAYENEDMTPYLKKIALSHKTPFQKRVLTLLCQVPRGQYTTYAAMSKHLSSSPRAVGNALKNNPFAPEVPCHRVLASGGGIGGFQGSWGRNGTEGLYDGKKRRLLMDEGVRFDGKGMAIGKVWDGFEP